MPLGKKETREDLYKEFFDTEANAIDYIKTAFEDGFNPAYEGADRKLYIDALNQAEKRDFWDLVQIMREEIKTWKESDLEGLDIVEKAIVDSIQNGIKVNTEPFKDMEISSEITYSDRLPHIDKVISTISQILRDNKYPGFEVKEEDGKVKIKGKLLGIDSALSLLRKHGFNFSKLNHNTLILNEGKEMNIEAETRHIRELSDKLNDWATPYVEKGVFDYLLTWNSKGTKYSILVQDKDKIEELKTGIESLGPEFRVNIPDSEHLVITIEDKIMNEAWDKRYPDIKDELETYKGIPIQGTHVDVQDYRHDDWHSRIEWHPMDPKNPEEEHPDLWDDWSYDLDSVKAKIDDYLDGKKLEESKMSKVTNFYKSKLNESKGDFFLGGDTHIIYFKDKDNNIVKRVVLRNSDKDDVKVTFNNYLKIYPEIEYAEVTEKNGSQYRIDRSELNESGASEKGVFKFVEFKSLKPDRLMSLNNGAYDLETKGLSGYYTWIGYSHNSRGTSEKKMRPVIQGAAYQVAREMEERYGGKAVIEDKWDTTDMFRVYVVSDSKIDEGYLNSVTDTLVDKYSLSYYPAKHSRIKSEIINLTGNADIAQDVIDRLRINYKKLNETFEPTKGFAIELIAPKGYKIRTRRFVSGLKTWGATVAFANLSDLKNIKIFNTEEEAQNFLNKLSKRILENELKWYKIIPYSEVEQLVVSKVGEEKFLSKREANRQSKERQIANRERRNAEIEADRQQPEATYEVTIKRTDGRSYTEKVKARGEIEAAKIARQQLKKRIGDNTWFVPGDDGYIHFNDPYIKKLDESYPRTPDQFTDDEYIEYLINSKGWSEKEAIKFVKGYAWDNKLDENIRQKDGYTIYNDVTYKWKDDTSSDMEYQSFVSGLKDNLMEITSENFNYFALQFYAQPDGLELEVDYQDPEIRLGKNDYPFEDVFTGDVLEYIEEEDKKFFDSVNKEMKDELNNIEKNILPRVAKEWGFRKQR